MTLIQYLLFGTTMPGFLFEQLISVMTQLKNDLINESLPSWIHVDKKYTPNILEYLNNW